jgi:DNA-binding PadR family transcriptional regulator
MYLTWEENRVSLKHALLGFIELMPLSGYDLSKMFDASVNLYWPATHTQIYRTLNRLLGDGLVTREVIEQSDIPDKKVYYITDKGRDELREWVSVPRNLPVIRHPLLVQIAFAGQVETTRVIALFEAYAEKLRERLKLYHTDQQRGQLSFARSERERFLWSLILENGIVTYECELKWVERAIEGLKTIFPE